MKIGDRVRINTTNTPSLNGYTGILKQISKGLCYVTFINRNGVKCRKWAFFPEELTLTEESETTAP